MNTNFDTFKKEAVEKQPIQYNTKLKNVRLESTDSISVDGKLLRISDSGLESLQKLVKLPNTFSNRVDAFLGKEARLTLVNALRNAMSDKDQLEVTVTLKKDGTVIGIQKRFPHISTEGYFDVIERVVDRYDLELSKWSVDGNGNVTVGTKAPTGEFQLGGFKDEYFETGPSFVNRMGQLEMFNYIERMICTNGMYALQETDHTITSVERKDMVKFFEQLDQMAKINFIPLEFQANVLRAMRVKASMREMERVYSTIRSYKVGDDNDERFVNWFVPMRDVRDAYRKIGYDPNDMPATQKKNALTNMTVWELINGFTDFASHDQTGRGFSFTASQSDSMMRDAGRMLTKRTFDTENLVETPVFA